LFSTKHAETTAGPLQWHLPVKGVKHTLLFSAQLYSLCTISASMEAPLDNIVPIAKTAPMLLSTAMGGYQYV